MNQISYALKYKECKKIVAYVKKTIYKINK